ncbi:MAG: DUF3817 domain-containing protein [Bacteriovoracia bacterium]
MNWPSSFLWIGRMEGISLLLLFFLAMPLKYLAGEPAAVRWVGAIHGVLFLAYVFAAFNLSGARSWPGRLLLICMVLSSVPFGTFYFERKYGNH